MGNTDDFLATLVPPDPNTDAPAADPDPPAPNRLDLLAKGAEVYRERYLRIAVMIAKKATGLAGMNDDIPPMDDLIRAREYFEEMEGAYLTARRTED